MSLKHRYVRARPPGEGQKGSKERYASASYRRAAVAGDGCTCWVLVRGDGIESQDRQTADCELVPDPACPIHGKKWYPILDEDSGG